MNITPRSRYPTCHQSHPGRSADNENDPCQQSLRQEEKILTIIPPMANWLMKWGCFGHLRGADRPSLQAGWQLQCPPKEPSQDEETLKLEVTPFLWPSWNRHLEGWENWHTRSKLDLFPFLWLHFSVDAAWFMAEWFSPTFGLMPKTRCYNTAVRLLFTLSKQHVGFAHVCECLCCVGSNRYQLRCSAHCRVTGTQNYYYFWSGLLGL